MKKYIDLGEKRIEYLLVRKNIKNINLRIRSDGSVYISVPVRLKNEQIERFILKNKDFILNAIVRFEKKAMGTVVPRDYIDGEYITVFGNKIPIRIEKAGKNTAKYIMGCIFIYVKDTDSVELKKKTLDKYLHEICKSKILDICKKSYPFFQHYGVGFPCIKFRSMLSKWGSCNSSDGILTFNYALIHAPVSCIEYVVFHEFTHFLHPDHSTAFYSRLTELMPDWKIRKSSLDMVCIRR